MNTLRNLVLLATLLGAAVGSCLAIATPASAAAERAIAWPLDADAESPAALRDALGDVEVDLDCREYPCVITVDEHNLPALRNALRQGSRRSLVVVSASLPDGRAMLAFYDLLRLPELGVTDAELTHRIRHRAGDHHSHR